MKAIVYTQYGTPDVMKLKQVEKPESGDNEILIKVHAVSVNYADWHALTGTPFIARIAFGFFRPRNVILGADIAGTVEKVGRNVGLFKPGDAVYGDLGLHGFGGFAEYICVKEEWIAHKPENLTFAQAAAVPMAAVTALQALRDHGQVQPGQKVLIHGAAGGVGTFAVQLAKYFGAHVTAVCSSRNTDLASSLGADEVIDYAREDFSANGHRYDLILGINGNRSINDYRRVLSSHGRYLMIGGSDRQIFQAMILGPLLSKKDGISMGGMTGRTNPKDLAFIKDLLEAGKIRPVIDRSYPLEETHAALRYIGEGHARGKVVIHVVDEGK